MNSDEIWNEIYKKHGFRAKYPDENLIRFISTKFRNVPDKKSLKVLDLGCGPGRHIIFLANQKFSVYGIDASETAIKMAKNFIEENNITADIRISEMPPLPYENDYFDLIIDCASIQHIKVDKIYRILKTGGMFFSIIRSMDDYISSSKQIANNTFFNLDDNTGEIHLFDEAEIRSLLKNFTELNIEHETRTFENMSKKRCNWIIAAKK